MIPTLYAKYQTLKLVAHRSGHTIGRIDTEGKLAAALLCEDLRNAGLAVAILLPDGPRYHITRAGRAWLHRYKP